MDEFLEALNVRAHSDRPIDMFEWSPDTRPFPKATTEQIVRSETQLGFKLPSLLRDIYMLIGNGGFGPGYGLFGIEGGAPEYVGEYRHTAPEIHAHFLVRRALPPPWPRHYLPIVTWGCEIYSALDCSSEAGSVYAVDPNRHGDGPWKCDCRVHARTLKDWLQRWLDGENMYESFPLDGQPKLGFEEEPKLRALGL